MMGVRVKHTVEVDFLRETPEVAHSARGWAEGAVETVQVEMMPSDDRGVIITLKGERYLLRGPVVEALYDVYQGEVPEGAAVFA